MGKINGEMVIFSGNSHEKLAKKVCNFLDTGIGKAKVSTFNDGETQVEIEESVRDMDVFIIQPTSAPVNNNLMELLVMIDAFKRASANRITAVIPYFGYARQDRKVESRQPISAKLTANLITAAGTDRVMTIDLHAGQIQGFFDIPLDNLYARPVLIKKIRDDFPELFQENFPTWKHLTIVSPDGGGVPRVRSFKKRLNEAGLAIVDKSRPEPGKSEVMNIIGDVKDRICIIVDDMIDTGGTLVQAADAILEKGATAVYAYLPHGVLSGNATERVKNSSLKKIVVTDTIVLKQEAIGCEKIEVVSIAELLAKAIRRINRSESVSSLFE